ncbi:MAG: T9SS type A sorting domain-containing protein [Bacteroidia bacterium]|nr:T9SS type A sorting domain-containing protein [Bacteroidia bacterium]
MKKLYVLIITTLIIQTTAFPQGLGTYHPLTVNVDGTIRDYVVYEPQGHTGTEPWPVVFNFHGFGGSPSSQVNWSQMFLVADTANFFVVYPKGLPVQDLIFGGTQPGWNVPGSYSASQDDVLFVSKIIDALVDTNTWAIDTGRVHATGFSNGAEMALYLACALSDRIASVGDVSGQMTLEMIYNLCNPTRQVSVLHMLGTNDPFFPVNGNATYPPLEGAAVYWAMTGNCDTVPTVIQLPDLDPNDGSTVTLKTYEECDENIEVLCYRIEGGGHCWPGGPNPCNNDIMASVELWEFFRRNPFPYIPTAITEQQNSVQLQVFPNPATSELSISGNNGTTITEVTIYNQIGQKVLYQKPVTQPIDVSMLRQGMYVIEVVCGNRKLRGKFVK